MNESTLRLRLHHVIDLYGYFLNGGKEQFEFSWNPERPRYGDRFVDRLVDYIDGFWKGRFAFLEVVNGADDLCAVCERPCLKDFRETHDFRSLGLVEGTYPAEKVKQLIRERARRTGKRILPNL